MSKDQNWWEAYVLLTSQFKIQRNMTKCSKTMRKTDYFRLFEHTKKGFTFLN